MGARISDSVGPWLGQELDKCCLYLDPCYEESWCDALKEAERRDQQLCSAANPLCDWYVGDMNHSVSEPVVACLHLVLGGTSQVRTGQRHGCKPFLNRIRTDSIAVREGEFLVSSRGFHRTRTVVLERTSLSDTPVIHAVWVWKGKPSAALVESIAL